MPKSRIIDIALVILVPANLLLGALVLYVHFGPARYYQTDVLAYHVVEEGPDYLEIDFDYNYLGDFGERAYIGATAWSAGWRSGRYVPDRLMRGRHTARVRLAVGSSDTGYCTCTEGVTAFFYRPKRPRTYRTVFPLKKCWE